MSENALKDHNVLPVLDLEKRNDSSSKGNFMKSCIEKSENFEKSQNKCPTSLSSSPSNATDVKSNGEEIGASEVEYIETENLTDLPDVDASLNTLLARLDSKNWIVICEALNNVRQLSIYHKQTLFDFLGNVILLIVKSLKSPRSAVCKTAIMTSADVFKVYSDLLIDSFDPLLTQLLLKSSQDKRFVCEAAERALVSMTTWVSPSVLLPKLQPYLKDRNPRIRAKASMCISRSVSRLGMEGIKSYGIDKLIQIAAGQLSDQLPESREAARTLALELQASYEKYQSLSSENSEPLVSSDSWEVFCHANLSPLSAQAILRITSTPKEGLMVGC